jgi:3',5'-cyclic-nucleotide phosphodiesterase
MISESLKARSFLIHNLVVYAGRSIHNDIQIKDKFVSRRHLKINKKAGKYFVKDLHSKNGTFIDGKQSSPGIEVEVGHGIPIVVGMSVLSLNQPLKDDVLKYLDSMIFFDHFDEDKMRITQDRPKSRQNNMNLINKTLDVVGRASDLKETLENILDYILSVFHRIDRGFIIFMNQESGEVLDIISKFRENLPDKVEYSKDIVTQVMRKGKAVIVPDCNSIKNGDLSDTLKISKTRSVICVPLVGKMNTVGVIYLDSIASPNGFRTEDFSLLFGISNPLAFAIEDSLLH